MLKRSWLWVGRFLGKLFLLLLIVSLGGWGIAAAYYGWKFSGPVSSEEQIPPGEPALTRGIIEDAIRVVEQHRSNTRVLRDAHAKAHGCVKAQVTVLTALDSSLRHGVFSEPGKTWPPLNDCSN